MLSSTLYIYRFVAVEQKVSEKLKAMTAQATTPSLRFVRRTRLNPQEYHRNFHKLDEEVIAAVTSREADQVTPLMSKIYLRLVNAPTEYWEREGVLRFEAEVREGKQVKAWAVLCELLGVASATASKSIQWLHSQGIIGYFSGKNGVGMRIFLNHAASSIGVRACKKILEFSPASSQKRPASLNEPAFNDSYAVLEDSDTDINSHAPKNGAESKRSNKTSPESLPAPNMVTVDEIVTRLKAELEPTMYTAARQSAAREHERTREWLENRGLPKAARVAQYEAYNVLRKYGLITETAKTSYAEVGKSNYIAPEPHPLSADEITELVEVCVAMLETQGQSIETTLSEMSVEAGGFVLPEDARRVREKVESLLAADERKGK